MADGFFDIPNVPYHKLNKFTEYKKFEEKFEQKKTTDDCYTPEPVYKAIKDWVFKRWNLPEDTQYPPVLSGQELRERGIPRRVPGARQPAVLSLCAYCALVLVEGRPVFCFWTVLVGPCRRGRRDLYRRG